MSHSLLDKEGFPGAGDEEPAVNEVVADARFLVERTQRHYHLLAKKKVS